MYILAILSLLAALSEGDWEQRLGPDRYRVMRKKGTEMSYSGHHLPPSEKTLYLCAACELPIFRSEEQFDVGNGWPNFTYPFAKENVYYVEDWSLGFKRYEVLCRGCDGHLGHVFNDGPPPKCLRYCINSICLKIENKD